MHVHGACRWRRWRRQRRRRWRLWRWRPWQSRRCRWWPCRRWWWSWVSAYAVGIAPQPLAAPPSGTRHVARASKATRCQCPRAHVLPIEHVHELVLCNYICESTHRRLPVGIDWRYTSDGGASLCAALSELCAYGRRGRRSGWQCQLWRWRWWKGRTCSPLTHRPPECARLPRLAAEHVAAT